MIINKQARNENSYFFLITFPLFERQNQRDLSRVKSFLQFRRQNMQKRNKSKDKS